MRKLVFAALSLLLIVGVLVRRPSMTEGQSADEIDTENVVVVTNSKLAGNKGFVVGPIEDRSGKQHWLGIVRKRFIPEQLGTVFTTDWKDRRFKSVLRHFDPDHDFAIVELLSSAPFVQSRDFDARVGPEIKAAIESVKEKFFTSDETMGGDMGLPAGADQPAQRQVAGRGEDDDPVSGEEAAAGFNNQTNGFTSQAIFNRNLQEFSARRGVAAGLGPVFNADSCVSCHFNPVAGGVSQVSEIRAGHVDPAGKFVEAAGGSLIQQNAINVRIQERVPETETVRTFRASIPLLGAGYVESIANPTLLAIRDAQPEDMRGLALRVPILEAEGRSRIGRFGWKAQHGSLVSFSADAFLNEMGITNLIFPTENTSLGRSVAEFDAVRDPENREDIFRFADFMRALRVPPPGLLARGEDGLKGRDLFNKIGCVTCHTAVIRTAPAGTVINGGAFTVPRTLGDKIIRPFSDFLLHDVGTGDGIVQAPADQITANTIRTPALWGIRARSRLMHDGLSLTVKDAILRHAKQAAKVIEAFKALPAADQGSLLVFVENL